LPELDRSFSAVKPGAPLGFLLRHALLLVALLDVLGLAFLLVRVGRFITLRHDGSPLMAVHARQPTPLRLRKTFASAPTGAIYSSVKLSSSA